MSDIPVYEKPKEGFVGPCSCPCDKCKKRGKHSPFKCPDNCDGNPATMEMAIKNCEDKLKKEGK